SSRSRASSAQTLSRNAPRAASGSASAAWKSASRRCQRWGSINARAASDGGLGGETAVQPGTGELPLAADRRGRHLERGGRLLEVEAAEVAQLDEARAPRVHRLQLGERLVEGEHVDVARADARHV